MNKYMLILGLMDVIEDWNEKLNSFSAENLDNVWIGMVIVVVLVIFGWWGVSYFSKK